MPVTGYHVSIGVLFAAPDGITAAKTVLIYAIEKHGYSIRKEAALSMIASAQNALVRACNSLAVTPSKEMKIELELEQNGLVSACIRYGYPGNYIGSALAKIDDLWAMIQSYSGKMGVNAVRIDSFLRDCDYREGFHRLFVAQMKKRIFSNGYKVQCPVCQASQAHHNAIQSQTRTVCQSCKRTFLISPPTPR